MAKNTQTAERTEPLEGEVIAPQRNAVSITPTVDKFISDLLPSKSAKELWGGLPEHISKELFKRNLFNALTQNGKLMDCSKPLLFREISKAAALGLLLDPLLGEAYLIIGQSGPQLRVGYKGLMKLARQSGNVAGLWCHEVYSNDEVEADLGHPKKYSHRPVLFGDRGEIIGYTAVVSYKDGSFDFEPMSISECLAIRDRSDAWKAYKADKIKSTPWGTDQSEMCKKTVFNRLMKRQDKSPEMRRAIEIENEAEFPSFGGREPTPAQLRAPAPPDDPESSQQNNTRDLSSERSSTPRGPRTVKAPEPPSETATAKVPAKMTMKDTLAWIEAKFAEVTPDLLEERPDILGYIWEVEVMPKLVDGFPPDVEAAQAIMRQHEKRLAP